MKNQFVFTVFTLLSFFSLKAQETIKLSEGTIIRLRLLEDLNSKTAEVGDMVTLEVAETITARGKVVIEGGARATGVVVQSAKAKMAGKKGKLNFTIDYAKAVDGSNVRLRSITGGIGDGKSRTGALIATAYLVNPAALLFKGKNATIEKGQEFTCYVDKDTEIEVRY